MFGLTTETDITMSEVKKFVGQPVLSQILDVILSSLIHQTSRKSLRKRHNAGSI
jgi:hypothetical protein